MKIIPKGFGDGSWDDEQKNLDHNFLCKRGIDDDSYILNCQPPTCTTYINPVTNNRLNEYEECEKSKSAWVVCLINAWMGLHGQDPEDCHKPTDYVMNRERRWFLSDEMYIGSFAWVCEELDLDKDYIRKMVNLVTPTYEAVLRLRWSLMGPE